MDTTNTKLYIYRQDGQWKIQIAIPKWVIDDILRESNQQDGVVITLYPESGVSPGYRDLIKTEVIASALFEKKNIEKPADE